MEEVDLDPQVREGALQSGHLAGREGRDVPVDGEDRPPGREQPVGGGALGPEGRPGAPLPEEVIERLPAAVGDESFGDDQARTGGRRQPRPDDEAMVPGVPGR
jgi:hypothetical protein